MGGPAAAQEEQQPAWGAPMARLRNLVCIHSRVFPSLLSLSLAAWPALGVVVPQKKLASLLVESGQEHLFSSWAGPGVDDEKKHAFFAQVKKLHESYPAPGGLAAYISEYQQAAGCGVMRTVAVLWHQSASCGVVLAESLADLHGPVLWRASLRPSQAPAAGLEGGQEPAGGVDAVRAHWRGARPRLAPIPRAGGARAAGDGP